LIKIPTYIEDGERIVRVLFYPKHFNKKEVIISYAFRSPPEMDEVSVIRIDFTNEDFCKNHGKTNQAEKNPYYGLGVISAKQIRSVAADVIYTPKHHDYHGDIKVGYIFKAGVTPPPEIKYIIEELAILVNVFKDSCPEINEWIDGKVFCK
jgi:hypothetical protein